MNRIAKNQFAKYFRVVSSQGLKYISLYLGLETCIKFTITTDAVGWKCIELIGLPETRLQNTLEMKYISFLEIPGVENTYNTIYTGWWGVY